MQSIQKGDINLSHFPPNQSPAIVSPFSRNDPVPTDGILEIVLLFGFFFLEITLHSMFYYTVIKSGYFIFYLFS